VQTLSQTYKLIIFVIGGALCGLAGAWLLLAFLKGTLLWLAPIAGAIYGFSYYQRHHR
jgi:hypothetical protein